MFSFSQLVNGSQPLPFLNGQEPIDRQIFQSVRDAAGPANLQRVNLGRLSQADMHAQIVLREVAPAAAHFIDEATPPATTLILAPIPSRFERVPTVRIVTQ